MPAEGRDESRRVETLVVLLKLGAGHEFVGLTTSRIGTEIGLSQQAASKKLSDLERRGLIERVHSGRGLNVRLTELGLQKAQAYYAGLKAVLEGAKEVTFRGAVFTGFGEGGYYVSLKGYAKPFKDGLGFEPYPGTLNLKLRSPSMVEQKRRLRVERGIDIPGFQDNRRTFGPVKCFKARVGSHRAAVLAIERTHYDDSVLEVIAPVNIRKAMHLKDGDECDVMVYP